LPSRSGRSRSAPRHTHCQRFPAMLMRRQGIPAVCR
jgi:hypothetical protein